MFLLSYLFLVKIAVLHQKLAFHIERVGVWIFNPVVKVRVLLDSNSFYAPVISVVEEIQALAISQAVQEIFEVPKIWFLCEFKIPAVYHVLKNFLWAPLTELLKGNRNFFLFNLGMFLRPANTIDILPRQLPLKKVYQNKAYGLQIISTGKLLSQVGMDTGVPGCSS